MNAPADAFWLHDGDQGTVFVDPSVTARADTVLAQIARALADRRHAMDGLLRARGSSIRALGRVQIVEGLVLAVPCALLAPWAARWLERRMGATWAHGDSAATERRVADWASGYQWAAKAARRPALLPARDLRPGLRLRLRDRPGLRRALRVTDRSGKEGSTISEESLRHG